VRIYVVGRETGGSWLQNRTKPILREAGVGDAEGMGRMFNGSPVLVLPVRPSIN